MQESWSATTKQLPSHMLLPKKQPESASSWKRRGPVAPQRWEVKFLTKFSVCSKEASLAIKTTNSADPPWKHELVMRTLLRIRATTSPEKFVFSLISTRSKLMLASVMAKTGALVLPVDSCVTVSKIVRSTSMKYSIRNNRDEATTYRSFIPTYE